MRDAGAEIEKVDLYRNRNVNIEDNNLLQQFSNIDDVKAIYNDIKKALENKSIKVIENNTNNQIQQNVITTKGGLNLWSDTNKNKLTQSNTHNIKQSTNFGKMALAPIFGNMGGELFNAGISTLAYTSGITKSSLDYLNETVSKTGQNIDVLNKHSKIQSEIVLSSVSTNLNTIAKSLKKISGRNFNKAQENVLQTLAFLTIDPDTNKINTIGTTIDRRTGAVIKVQDVLVNHVATKAERQDILDRGGRIEIELYVPDLKATINKVQTKDGVTYTDFPAVTDTSAEIKLINEYNSKIEKLQSFYQEKLQLGIKDKAIKIAIDGVEKEKQKIQKALNKIIEYNDTINKTKADLATDKLKLPEGKLTAFIERSPRLREKLIQDIKSGKITPKQVEYAGLVRAELNKLGDINSTLKIQVGNNEAYIPTTLEAYNPNLSSSLDTNATDTSKGYAQLTYEQKLENGIVSKNLFATLDNAITNSKNRIQQKLLLDKLLADKTFISKEEYDIKQNNFTLLNNKTDLSTEEQTVKDKLQKEVGKTEFSNKYEEVNVLKEKLANTKNRNTKNDLSKQIKKLQESSAYYNSPITIDNRTYYTNNELHNVLYLGGLLDSASVVKSKSWTTNFTAYVLKNALERFKNIEKNNAGLQLLANVSDITYKYTLGTARLFLENNLQALAWINNIATGLITDLVVGDTSTIQAMKSTFTQQGSDINQLLSKMQGNTAFTETIANKQRPYVLSQNVVGKILLDPINKLLGNHLTKLILNPSIELQSISINYFENTIHDIAIQAHISDSFKKLGISLMDFDPKNQIHQKLLAEAQNFAEQGIAGGDLQSSNSLIMAKIAEFPIAGKWIFGFSSFLYKGLNYTYKLNRQTLGSIDKIRKGDRSKANIKALVQALLNTVWATSFFYLFANQWYSSMLGGVSKLIGGNPVDDAMRVLGYASPTDSQAQGNTRAINPFIVNLQDGLANVKDANRIISDSRNFTVPLWNATFGALMGIDPNITKGAREAIISNIPGADYIPGLTQQTRAVPTLQSTIGSTLAPFIPSGKIREEISSILRIMQDPNGQGKQEVKAKKDSIAQNALGPETSGLISGILDKTVNNKIADDLGLRPESKVYTITDPNNPKKVTQVAKDISLVDRILNLLPGGKENINVNYLQSGVERSQSTLAKDYKTIQTQLDTGKITSSEYQDSKQKLDTKANLYNLDKASPNLTNLSTSDVGTINNAPKAVSSNGGSSSTGGGSKISSPRLSRGTSGIKKIKGISIKRGRSVAGVKSSLKSRRVKIAKIKTPKLSKVKLYKPRTSSKSTKLPTLKF